MSQEELNGNQKFERNFKWYITKDMVYRRSGLELSDEEFLVFAKHFEQNFMIQYAMVLEWLIDEWDEIKTWDVPENPDISHLLW
jgi:hypothetical protein